MIRFFSALLTVLTIASAPAHAADLDAAYQQKINAFLDEWHDDAAHSRARFFDKMAPDAIYIGTDKTERWTRDELRAWSKPYFARPSAWAFTAIKRHIAGSADQQFIWFDEQLSTQMGVCQASGVIRSTGTGFQILHYQLSIAVPNELADQVVESIRQGAAGSGAAKPAAP